MRRSLCILLAVSLAGNVFLLSFDGLVAWRLHQGGLAAIEHFMGRGLAGGDRAVLDASFARNHAAILAALAESAAAHRAADQALRARPFNPAAYRAALDGWRAAFDNFLASFEQPMVQAATGMSQAGRDTMAARSDVSARRDQAAAQP